MAVWNTFILYVMLSQCFLGMSSFILSPFSGHLAERTDLRIFLTVGMATSGFTTILFGLGYYLDIHMFAYYFIAQVFWPVFNIHFLRFWLVLRKQPDGPQLSLS